MIRFKLKRRASIKYNSCDIPAMLFFDELMQGNVTVLGKGTPDELHLAYMSILDEYCDIDGNKKMLDWFRKQAKISKIQLAITAVESCLFPIKHICVTSEQYKKAIDLINTIGYPKVNFSFTKPLTEEINRVERVTLGILRNDLQLEQGVEGKQKENLKKEFVKRLVAVENVLGRPIDETVTLRKFIYLEKAALDKANHNKK